MDGVFVEKIGKYLIIKKIGSGGMGDVYLGRDPSTDQQVAIKVLSPFYANNEKFVGRFLREVRSLSFLDHKNIVKIVDFGKEDNRLFLAMEYLEGVELGMVLLRRELTEEQSLYIAKQVAMALEHAWNSNIVHRDIKPENIFIQKDQNVKVMDWGIAKDLDSEIRLTETGMTYGTPEYISPEQIQGLDIDCRTDIYALGCTLFQMLTRELPYSDLRQQDIVNNHLYGKIPSPRKKNKKVTPKTAKLVKKMMRKKMASRPTPTQLIHLIDSILWPQKKSLYSLIIFIILGLILLLISFVYFCQ